MPAALDALPLPPRSAPFGSASDVDGVLAQTFRTTGLTPEAVVEHFDEELAALGWQSARPVHREPGPGRADFTLDGERLEVSADAVDLDPGTGSEQAVVQFSLLLRPD